MYSNSQSSLSSHLQRERSLRHTYTEPHGAAPEFIPPSNKVTRSQSTAGLSNGLDLKVVILGAQGVGKTSLVHRYTSGHFSASSVPSTIGASFLTKKLIVDDVKVRLQLWDTAGQERFRSMAPMYYRGSNAAVIVYDITNPSSFQDVKTWIDELRKNVHSDLIIHIVGSKADLAARSRKVDLEEAREEILNWTKPHRPQQSPPTAPSLRSRSAFGALISPGNVSTSMVASASQTIPTSPSTHGSSRLAGFGGLTSLGSKSRLGLSPPTTKGGEEEEGADVDANSTPSSSSSGGGAQGGEKSKQEDWDLIEVSEVSSKDNEGIEDVFVGIATRLVERKEEMEALAKSRLDRNSVFLGDDSDGDIQVKKQESGSWCCST
ncbi:hypothetical protein CBS101457_005922 [Exobasidium rhododendri]|nr:hypothetical protein CBS101457_005922 [Exobasidium rhododendri]